MKAAKRENLPYLNCKALIPRGEACPCMRERERKAVECRSQHSTRPSHHACRCVFGGKGARAVLCCGNMSLTNWHLLVLTGNGVHTGEQTSTQPRSEEEEDGSGAVLVREKLPCNCTMLPRWYKANRCCGCASGREVETRFPHLSKQWRWWWWCVWC